MDKVNGETMNNGRQWTMECGKHPLSVGAHCSFKNRARARFVPLSLKLLLFFSFLFLPLANLTAEISYTVDFIGIPETCVRDTLESVSTLVTLKDKPPATPLALKARVDNDVTTLIKPLHSLGYYDAAIEPHLTQDCEGTHIELHFYLGPQYRFSKVCVIQAPERPLCPADMAAFQTLHFTADELAEGAPALAQSVVDGRESLLYDTGLLGFPLPKIIAERVVVDRRCKTVSVTYVLDVGPRAVMGCVSIDGLKCVKRSVINHVICWREGDPYSPCPLEETEEALLGLNLFDYVKVHIDDQMAEDGCSIPIYIEVMESKHHSVGLGLSYTTQLGGGVSGEWVHRNVNGRGERLELQGVLWQLQQEAIVAYTIPNVWQSYQDLILKAEYEHENPLSFNEHSAEVSAILRTRLNCKETISYGLAFKRLHSTRSRDNGRYSLLKVPFTYTWRNTDYLEDPSEGLTFSFKATPNQDLQPDYVFFFNAQATTTFYIPLDSKKRQVFAGKFLVGSITGTNTPNVPAPERFYGGTEQTLRGYRYLTVSPLDAANQPLGGNSISVASFELRHKITQTYGVVLFYEIGNVYTPSYPEFYRKQLQSAGVGLRYYTPVGPLRLDIAFPLNRRPGIDHFAEFYFSIGQTF